MPEPSSMGASSTPDLQAELAQARQQAITERQRAEGLAEELRLTKLQSITTQKLVEQEEEFITNKLMKRLDQLKTENAMLATEVQREEEFMTNTLQRKLDTLAREKVDLENRLEAEQEHIVNKLSKQLDCLSQEKTKLHREKVALENQLEAEQEFIVNKLQKQVDSLASDKGSLAKEKTELQRQVTDLGACVQKLARDKVALEQQFEVEEENLVNRLQRQLEALVSDFRLVEARLEARGSSLRDLGILPSQLPLELTHTYSRGSSVSSSFDRSANPSFGLSLGGGGSGGTLLVSHHSSPHASHSPSASAGTSSQHNMQRTPSGGPGAGVRRERPTSGSSNGGVSEVLQGQGLGAVGAPPVVPPAGSSPGASPLPSPKLQSS